MDSATMVGIDLGKHSFHLRRQDRKGLAVSRKKCTRKQLLAFFFAKFHPCMAVMEACAGAHFLARKLIAMGHAVKLISPQHVRPFVKGNKNAFIDVEAICEAASRPTMLPSPSRRRIDLRKPPSPQTCNQLLQQRGRP